MYPRSPFSIIVWPWKSSITAICWIYSCFFSRFIRLISIFSEFDVCDGGFADELTGDNWCDDDIDVDDCRNFGCDDDEIGAGGEVNVVVGFGIRTNGKI